MLMHTLLVPQGLGLATHSLMSAVHEGAEAWRVAAGLGFG